MTQGLETRARALDAHDRLAAFRARFHLREGLIYLDGNSLGALPDAARGRLARSIEEEWGEGLITSWLGAEWSTAPQRIGDKIARLIGAQAGEVIAADSTSVNIFKALAAAISLRPGRSVILTESGNFPTDHYMMQGIETLSGGRITAKAVAREALFEHVNADVAAVLLTHVHYKSAEMYDLARVTAGIQQQGALAIWDFSHSTGALPIDVGKANVDFAIGCGYKFLNGGPGAPAYLYAPARHHRANAVLSGWFGHAAPFDFEEEYRPAAGIERFLCGTPPILGLAALEAGVDLALEADLDALRAKSIALADLLIAAMEPLCKAHDFVLVSPRGAAQRGSHLGYAHPKAYEMVQALRALDVIADFRKPDVIRFGLTPLYLRHIDMLDAAGRLEQVCAQNLWDTPQYRVRAAVT